MKMFNEGKVCLLKMNPVNAYVGPFIEEAFAEPIRRGFLAVVYGGAEEGTYLCKHPGVDEVHITGSDKTHDTIVWGPPGPERAERMAHNHSILERKITSELGNVSPVLLVPGPYSKGKLAHAAENIAGQVIVNASFNCMASKVIVTPERWERRDELLADLRHVFGEVPPRRAFYPGALERYAALTEGRTELNRVGAGEGSLPWTIVPGLDPDVADKAWATEPFCSIISETSVGSASDPVEYLERAVAFTSDRLWGTLSATILIHPETASDPKVAEALERAVVKLQYGAVAINIWPGMLAGIGIMPWGGRIQAPHPVTSRAAAGSCTTLKCCSTSRRQCSEHRSAPSPSSHTFRPTRRCARSHGA
jgi:aldehyde dehydrogenase (NAD(P)+)